MPEPQAVSKRKAWQAVYSIPEARETERGCVGMHSNAFAAKVTWTGVGL
jgi:hypothetical protein